MSEERGLDLDHTNIYRRVIINAPKILGKLKWSWNYRLGLSWRVDKTYIKVKGKWAYL